MPRPKEPKYVEAEEGYVKQKISEVDKIESSRVLLEEIERMYEKADYEIHLRGRKMSKEEVNYLFGVYDTCKKIIDWPEEAREWLERQKTERR